MRKLVHLCLGGVENPPQLTVKTVSTVLTILIPAHFYRSSKYLDLVSLTYPQTNSIPHF